MATNESVAKRIDEILDVIRLEQLVKRYFDPKSPFAGATFDELGTNDRDGFASDDLLVLNLLDESLGPIAMRRLLAGECDNALRLTDHSKPLWETDESGRATANALQRQLRTLPGIGPTKAAKLCARKRPHLIPIYDSVVQRVFDLGAGEWWPTLAAALSSEDRRSRINALGAGLKAAPSTLRLVDVATWMIGSNARTARDARAGVGLPPDPVF